MLKLVQHGGFMCWRPDARIRNLVVLSLAVLAPCSSGGDEVRGEPIECAIGLATKMTMDCRLEKVRKGKFISYVVRHPDGGFRRLVFAPGGKALVPADGADEATSVVTKGAIEVTIEQDHYRIPLSLLEPANDR